MPPRQTFSCRHCGKPASSHEAALAHAKREHGGEKPPPTDAPRSMNRTRLWMKVITDDRDEAIETVLVRQRMDRRYPTLLACFRLGSADAFYCYLEVDKPRAAADSKEALNIINRRWPGA